MFYVPDIVDACSVLNPRVTSVDSDWMEKDKTVCDINILMGIMKTNS